MDQTGGDGGDDGDALDELGRWVAEARVDDAIDHRRRASWLRRQAADEASFSGLMVSLAEHGRPVVVEVAGGRRHRGRLTLVGHDVVGLTTTEGGSLCVALDTVRALRPMPGSASVIGDQPLDPTATLAGQLRRHRDQRDQVALMLREAEPVVGTITGVGRDVITLRLAVTGEVYVPLWSVAEVSTPESG